MRARKTPAERRELRKHQGWVACPGCLRRTFWFIFRPRRCRYCGERLA